MKKIAFIPARSGSKRLPNKNVKMLGHMPLVCWTLKAFLDSQCFDEVIFSSDSERYWDIVNEYISSEKLKFHLRTERESGDKIKIFDYIKDNIDVLCKEESIFSLGLPTCPFRNSNHVQECFSLFESEKRPVFSASEYEFSVSFSFSIEGNNWKPLFENSPMITGNTRSQEQTKFYRPNGAVYIFNSSFLNSGVKTFYDGAMPYIMSKNDSIDVDTIEDFQIAKSLI